MMDDFVLFDSFRSNVTLLCLPHSFSFEHQHSLVQVRRSHRITLIHTNHQRILTQYIYLPPKPFTIAFSSSINIASSSLYMLYMPKPALYQRISLHATMPIYTMSIFSRFKKPKKTLDTDKELPPLPIEARALQFDTKPLPTPLIVCGPQDWPLLATPVIPVQEEPQPKTPTSPTRFSSEEALARIAAIKKRKSEMSLRTTSPPKRYYAQFHARTDSFEPPCRPLQRVRSDMSLRVPVPKEPARPKTSSGHSTRSSRSTRYVDNYSFYAHNRSPLQEFGPKATSTSFPAPQVPRTRSYENLSSSRKSPRTFQNVRRPSLLHLTMEEGTYNEA